MIEKKEKLNLWLKRAYTGKSHYRLATLLVFSVSSATMLMFILTS